MRRILLLAILLSVGLGLTLAPFHTHPDGRRCNVCKDIRTATPATTVVAVAAGPRTPEPVVLPATRHLPEAHSYTRPPLRAPPAA